MHCLEKILVTAICALSISCGGGGASTSSQPVAQLSLSASPNKLEINTPTSGSETHQLKFTVDKWANGTTLYFRITYSTNSIESITYQSNVYESSVLVDVINKTPWAIGAGTYLDNIVVQVSTDPQGHNQIINSPLTLPVTCNVYGPAVVTYSPTYARVGDTSFTLNLTGSGFGDSILWGGHLIPISAVSSTQATAQIPASELTDAASPTLYLFNRAQSSEQFLFYILPPGEPPPTISPSSAVAGGPAFTINIIGKGFVPSEQIQWNTDKLTTTYISANQLSAQVPASKIASQGTANVYAVWGSGQGIANMFTFMIQPPNTSAATSVSGCTSLERMGASNTIQSRKKVEADLNFEIQKR